MTAADCRQRLDALMRRQVDYVDRANRYLADIKQAIAESRLDDLQSMLAEPHIDPGTIESLEGERRSLLESHGYSGEGAMKACIQWCDDDAGRLTAGYDDLVERLESMQRAIQLNNLLVNRGRDRVRRSIGILTGLGTPADSNTYGANGHRIDAAERRNLAIA